MKNRRRTRRQSGATLAETGPVLWVFFFFFVLPLLDLVSFCTGVVVVMLEATWGVRQAAPCATASEAFASLQSTEKQLRAFQMMAKMSPASGSSGVSLAVQVTPIGGTPRTYGPFVSGSTLKIPTPIDSNSICQYLVTATYNVSPLINFAYAPILSNIPGIGKPVPVTFNASGTVEHPDGLNN